MKNDHYEHLIPEQVQGKKTDLSHSENFTSRYDAVKCFKRACKRLLNPRIWHELAGVFSAEFYLTGEDDRDPHRLARPNDHLKIDIPGPGPTAGAGYDWVQIKRIEDGSNADAEDEKAGLLLMPCKDPTGNDNNIAHFFTDSASSSIIIVRNGNKVTSFYHGRNEVPNNKTDKVVDNVRNTLVGTGAMASLSEAQWMNLIKAFLKPEIGE